MITRFALVGLTAMAVHWSLAAALISADVSALLANVLGFICALGVSYQGHGRWTFSSTRSWQHSLPRFLVSALGGFALNQSLYALSLLWIPLDPRLLLAMVILVVAGISFLVYRLWAFA